MEHRYQALEVQDDGAIYRQDTALDRIQLWLNLARLEGSRGSQKRHGPHGQLTAKPRCFHFAYYGGITLPTQRTFCHGHSVGAEQTGAGSVVKVELCIPFGSSVSYSAGTFQHSSLRPPRPRNNICASIQSH